MQIENARLAAYLRAEEPSELKRRCCIALFQSTGEKACRDDVLAHMDKNSGMSLLFAFLETGDPAYLCRQNGIQGFYISMRLSMQPMTCVLAVARMPGRLWRCFSACRSI